MKKLMGIFDLAKSASPVGDLLILQEELKICSKNWNTGDSFEIAFVGNKNSLLESLALGMEGVVSADQFSKIGDVQNFINKFNKTHSPYPLPPRKGGEEKGEGNLYLTWPEISPYGTIPHEYGYTLFIQESFRKNRSIPILSCKQEAKNWADQFVKDHAFPFVPIAVHLKNKFRSGERPDWYNARMESWASFFRLIDNQYEVKFILIGNEPLPESIRECSNVVVSQDFGSNLLRDLALIESSFAFMGVASGPCQMAMFRKSPYVIFKNPEHHIERMFEELGSKEEYCFASAGQRFLRQFETVEKLMEEFEKIADLHPQLESQKRKGASR